MLMSMFGSRDWISQGRCGQAVKFKELRFKHSQLQHVTTHQLFLLITKTADTGGDTGVPSKGWLWLLDSPWPWVWSFFRTVRALRFFSPSFLLSRLWHRLSDLYWSLKVLPSSSRSPSPLSFTGSFHTSLAHLFPFFFTLLLGIWANKAPVLSPC